MSSSSCDQVRAAPLDRRDVLIGGAAAISVLGMPANALAFPATKSLGDILSQSIAAEFPTSGAVPGIGALEVRAGRIAAESVRGVREAGTQSFVRAGDLWHIGSNAKPMTAALVARLIERGALSWNGRLEDRLPDLAGSMRPEFRDITLLELVTHRSGLATNADLTDFDRFHRDGRPLPEQRLDYLARALGEEPAGPRGAYHYSNSAFIAAGAVAERMTGRSFEELIRSQLFEPLRMHSVGLGPTPRGQPLGHADGRARLPPQGDNPLMWAPAGGMHMSLADWAKFAIDQMGGRRGSGKLLRKESYAFLQTAPEGHQSAVDWGIRHEPFGRLLMHTGSNGAWYAITALAPELRNAVIVATNIDGTDANSVVDRVFKRITASWASTQR